MAFHQSDLDLETSDRLVSGRMAPDDAPPAYREVARLLQDARAEHEPSDVTDDALIVAMIDAITAGSARGRVRVLPRVAAVKVAAVGVIALSATGAAAATGSLPDAAQSGIARAAAHVGIHLPDPAADRAREQTDVPGPAPGNHDEPETTEPSDDTSVPAADRQAPAGTEDPPTSAGPGKAPGLTAPHGDAVSDAAQHADPGGGKGDEVAPIARDNPGADARELHQPPDPGTGNANPNPNAGGPGTPSPHANPNAGGAGSTDPAAGGEPSPRANR
jgi:hypothetical protein